MLNHVDPAIEWDHWQATQLELSLAFYRDLSKNKEVLQCIQHAEERGNSAMDYTPSRGEKKYSQLIHVTKTRIKIGQVTHADFTFLQIIF